MILDKALKYSYIKHLNQKRKNSEMPYFTHPIISSLLVKKYIKKNKSLQEKIEIILILHDVLEDTNATKKELIDNFGTQITQSIINLTNDKDMINALGKKEYIKHKLLMLENEDLIAKLLDRLHNVLDNPTLQYVLDTLEIIYFFKNINTEANQYSLLIANDIEYACKLFIINNTK